MPLLFLPSVLLVQSVKGGVVVAGVEVEEILQGEALHGGGRMELGGGGVVDGEGGEEVALNDGVQALEVDVFGENAFGGEFVHEERVGIIVVCGENWFSRPPGFCDFVNFINTKLSE